MPNLDTHKSQNVVARIPVPTWSWSDLVGKTVTINRENDGNNYTISAYDVVSGRLYIVERGIVCVKCGTIVNKPRSTSLYCGGKCRRAMQKRRYRAKYA